MKIPDSIALKRKSNVLELRFGEQTFRLAAEYLRVHSPSAEVRGHGDGQAVLQTGKLHVALTGAEPQGNYGLRLIFDDGHSTGIYTWDYLHDLGLHHAQHWQAYLNALAQSGASRDPDVQVIQIQ